MFKKKYDYLFIKNKVLNYTIEQAKETISLLYTEQGIIKDQPKLVIEKALKKQIKKDLNSGVKRGIKFVNSERKKLIKMGAINPKDDVIQFLYNIGVFVPSESPDLISDDQEPSTPEKEPSDPEEPAQEGESEDKPESSTEETVKAQPETGDKGGETFLSAKEEKAEKRTAKIETEK